METKSENDRFVVIRIKESTRRRIKEKAAPKGLKIWEAVSWAFE